MKPITIFFLALVITACSNTYKEEIKSIKELQEKLSEAEKEYATIDINKIAQAKDNYTYNMEVFKAKYISDTINQKLSNDVNEYKFLKKGSNNVLANYALISENLDICKTQLDNLLSDLKHDALTPDEVGKYMEVERKRTTATIDKIIETKATYTKLIRIHDTIGPRIERVVDSLKKL
jgi:flagellar biosynthesis component FlhA